jgi:hypothetical protein
MSQFAVDSTLAKHAAVLIRCVDWNLHRRQ